MTSDNLTVADLAAIDGNNNGFGGDGAWWLLLLFLILGGGWNNGIGGGATPYMVNNDVQRGFDQSALMNGINGLNTTVANGFANAELGRANSNLTLVEGLNNISMAQQQCCCENRAAVADLKYTVATEACADRNAISDGVRDIIANQTAGIQTILGGPSSIRVARESWGVLSSYCRAKATSSSLAERASLMAQMVKNLPAM